MRQEFQKLKNNIVRLLTNEALSQKMYLGWAAVAILLIGVFGILPVSRELLNKYTIIVQMTELNKALSKKIDDVSNASKEIELIAEDIIYLNSYLPEDFEIQNYMIDFITAAGVAGYYVDSFTPATESGGAIGIFVTLSGDGDLITLIKSIENLKRVSEIQDVNLSNSGTENSLRLTVTTYIMEKQ